MECFLDSSSNTFLMRSPSSPNLNNTVLAKLDLVTKNTNVQEDIDGNPHVIAYKNIDNNGDQLPIMLPSDNLVQVISDLKICSSLPPDDNESILANERLELDAVDVCKSIKGREVAELELQACSYIQVHRGPTRKVSKKRNDRQRRQKLISEKLHDLQNLVPHSHKRDHATILDDAAQYIKSLKLHMDELMLQWNGESLYQQAPYAAHQTPMPMMSSPDNMHAARMQLGAINSNQTLESIS